MFSNTPLVGNPSLENGVLLGFGDFTYFEQVEAWGFWIMTSCSFFFFPVLWLHCCLLGVGTQGCMHATQVFTQIHSRSVLSILSEWFYVHILLVTLCSLTPASPWVMEPKPLSMLGQCFLSLVISLARANLNLTFLQYFIEISIVFSQL